MREMERLTTANVYLRCLHTHNLIRKTANNALIRRRRVLMLLSCQHVSALSTCHLNTFLKGQHRVMPYAGDTNFNTIWSKTLSFAPSTHHNNIIISCLFN